MGSAIAGSEGAPGRPADAVAGFTLMELMVVIAVLSLAALLVLPRLPDIGDSGLRDSARSLASVIRYLGDNSVTRKVSYRLHLDITEGTTSVTRRNDLGEQVPTGDNFLGRQLLSEGVTVEDVVTQRRGKINTGEVAIDFGPGGLEEYLVIHLRSGSERHFTITAYPQSSKVTVTEGYREEEGT